MAGLNARTWTSRASDGMAAAYLRESPNVEQTDTSDPFAATGQTVRYMCRLVKHSQSDPIVWQAAESALRLAPLAGSAASSIWAWAKASVKFVHHSLLLAAWLGRGDELQLLISPEALLKMESPKGDCAVFTTLICALLDCAGLGWEIVTVAANRRQPDIFSHVYPRAVLSDGRRIALDASHGQYAGWEVPAEHVSRKQVWNSEGQPINDQDSGYRGLHGVNMGLGCMDCGMGDATTDEFGGDVNYGTADQIYATPDPVVTPPAGMSPQAQSALANLANSWTTIFGRLVAPTTTIQTPQGLQVQTPASQTGTLASLFGGGGLSTASSGSSSLFFWGALALGGFLVIKAMSK